MLIKTNKTGRGRASHYHVVYASEASGNIEMSVDNDHTHLVELVGGSLDVQAGGKDGHTHDELFPVEPTKFVPTETDSELVHQVTTLYKEGLANESESRDKGIESEKFYSNKQWEERDILELDANDRAALTINEIEGKIDVLSGHQRQNRTDIRFLPVEGADQRVADILTILTKNILEQNNFEYQETEVFDDGMIAGRGLFNVFIDYDKNIDGDIIVEWFPWKNAVFGPHNKKDNSDGEWLVKHDWFSKARLRSLFPDKAEKLQRQMDFFMRDGDNSVILDNPPDQYDPAVADGFAHPPTIDPNMIDIARKEFKVLEMWRKVYKKAPVVVQEDDEFKFDGEDVSVTDINKMKTIPSLRVVDRRVARMRVSTVASNTLLADEFPDLAIDEFHLLPFYAKKKGKLWWGKVESVKDMQMEINKRHSQAIDIMNKVAAYGWFFDSATFKSQYDKEIFKNSAAAPGFIAEVVDTLRPPVQAEGVNFPAEIANMMAIDSQKVKEIMNVNLEVPAQRAESGIAIVEKRRSQLIGNEFLFDNLSLTKRTLGRMIVAMIKKVYTPERIMRVLESKALREAVKIGGQALIPMLPQEAQQLPQEEQVKMAEQMIQQKRQELLDMLDEDDLTKYDVVVAESAWSPTTRQANFVIWAELAGRGVPVPPDLLVDLSDLPEKEKVKQAMQAQQQAEAQLEQQKMQTEIVKTQIAKSDEGTLQ